jgi:predicted SprT family Zn-dependent metalloprotease
MAKRKTFKEAPAHVGAKKLSAAKSVHSAGTKSNTMPPTLEIADELQKAFAHFNQALFDNNLPHVVLTLTRLRKYEGLFAPKRWLEQKGKKADHHEIQLDAVRIREKGAKHALQTLVHEMCHLLVYTHTENAKEKHNPYHCKKWAGAMKAVGLQPVAVVKGVRVEGKETGASCTDDIIPGGEFDKSADALIKEGFHFSWGAVAEPEKVKKQKSKKAGAKVAHVCPKCEQKAWGKPSLNITCGDCKKPMKAQGGKDDGEDGDE